ncbi:VOC family protein [Alienimonas sp. DA493]|uniref:VOC family protein n=1 Tax=Alienimonas sp. DA493 TaxID=3373605 RepID=UPI003754F468
MQPPVPCLWFDGDAEEAAAFYTSLLPDSRVGRVLKSPVDTPGAVAGQVITVEFTLAGAPYVILNGGPGHPHTQAVSFQIHCEDQAEVDRLWAALEENGGSPMACGWITDRWGVCWQIVPKRLMELIADPDPQRAERAMNSMMEMIKIDVAEVERAADGAAD